jgi:hypothetical protein
MRSHDPTVIDEGLRWITEQIHGKDLIAPLLLTLAVDCPEHVTHCLTLYGHWIDCHTDVYDIPSDSEGRLFLDVSDVLLLSANPSASSLLAKPIIDIWKRMGDDQTFL